VVSRLEALADAIVHYSGWDNPESELYQDRNPGGLKAFSPKHARDLKGLRVFKSLTDGYQALLFDLAIKCVGRSNTHLKIESTLRDLICALGFPGTTAQYVARFLRRALRDDTISEKTQVNYFVME